MSESVPLRSVTSANLERVKAVHRITMINIAVAVLILGGLFGVIGLAHGYTGAGVSQFDLRQGAWTFGGIAGLGAGIAAVVELRYRLVRRRIRRR